MADKEMTAFTRSTDLNQADETSMPKRSPSNNPPVTKQEQALADLLERVEALRAWGQEWADYDAPPPSDATIQRAKQWIKEMYHDVSSRCLAWLDPMITASEEGEITFEWWNADRKLT